MSKIRKKWKKLVIKVIILFALVGSMGENAGVSFVFQGDGAGWKINLIYLFVDVNLQNNGK